MADEMVDWTAELVNESVVPSEVKLDNVHTPATWRPFVKLAPPLSVSKPFVTTFRESSRDIIVVPLEFLKAMFLVAVVLRLVKSIASALDARVAKISTEFIKKELVFVVMLYPNVAIFSQAFIEGVSGFTR